MSSFMYESDEEDPLDGTYVNTGLWQRTCQSCGKTGCYKPPHPKYHEMEPKQTRSFDNCACIFCKSEDLDFGSWKMELKK